MSSTFSFSRLGKLIAKQFFENSRLYMYSILAIIGLLALMFTFWIMVDGPFYREEASYFIFLIGLFFSGTVFASMSFSMLSSKDKGMYWLSIPATHFEKMVCTLFYTTILFTTVYILSFLLVKSIAIPILENYISNKPGYQFVSITALDENFKMAMKYFMCTYIAVQSIYFLGSVYFSRYAFILTTVVGAAIFFVVGYYTVQLQDKVLGDVSWDMVSVKINNEVGSNSYKLYSIPATASDAFRYFLMFAGAPIFWVITWYRLKEKEI